VSRKSRSPAIIEAKFEVLGEERPTPEQYNGIGIPPDYPDWPRAAQVAFWAVYLVGMAAMIAGGYWAFHALHH
jgi:hypothetical protein